MVRCSQDGVAQDQGIVTAYEACGYAGLDVGKGIGDSLLLACTYERCKTLFRPGELEQGKEVAIAVEPLDRGGDALLDAPQRIRFVGDGLALVAAEIMLGICEEPAKQLLLGVEVPVEHTFAHPEPIDDVGHRSGVIAVGGESLGSVVEKLLLPPPASLGESPLHVPTLAIARRIHER